MSFSIGKPLSPNTRDNEQNKFKQNHNENVAVRVDDEANFKLGVHYDEVNVTYNSDNDVYVFSLNSTVTRTVTVTYDGSAKDNITRVVVV